MKKSVCCIFLLVLLFGKSYGRQATLEEENEIKANAKAYEEAYNKRDAKALSSFWDENGKYNRPDFNQTTEGRKAIIDKIAGFFTSGKHGTLSIQVDKVDIPSEGKAIEIGRTLFTESNGEITRTTYKVELAKKENKWVIQNVREMVSKIPPSNHEQLKDLDWLVGKWTDNDEDFDILVVCSWDASKNFLTQKTNISIYGEDEMTINQLIGWDPIQKRIRSWVFDTDGGFGDGVWTQKGNSWVVMSTFILPNGSKGSAENTYTKIDDHTITWKSTNRQINGEKLPDVKEVKMFRSKQEV